jgi:UDP-glucose 4-epimerase
VYGPRELSGEHGTVVATMLTAHKNGQPIIINGTGEQMRCFTHVLDTVAGILLAAEKGEGDGYGIGAEDCHSLKEVAEKIGGTIEFREATKSTRSTSKVDSSKLKALGWQSQYTLEGYIAGVTA